MNKIAIVDIKEIKKKQKESIFMFMQPTIKKIIYEKHKCIFILILTKNKIFKKALLLNL